MARSSVRQWVSGFGTIFLVNLLPLVGVFWFGWDAQAVLFLYFVEAVVTTLLAIVKILLAGQTPTDGHHQVPLSELLEKRGGLRLRANWPPIYPRNVPFAAGVIVMWATGGLAYLVTLALELSIRPTEVLTTATVLSALLFVGVRVREFKQEFLDAGEYEYITPLTAYSTPAQHLLLIMMLAIVGQATEATGILVAVVCLKLLAEVGSFYVEHANHEDGWLVRIFGHTDTAETLGTVDVPEEEPTARIQIDTRAVLLGQFPVAVILALASRPALAFLASVGLATIVAGWPALLLGVGLFGGYVLLRLGTLYLVHGTIEYQKRGDVIVAYDRLLDAPQWVESVRISRDVEVENRIPDRLLGTRTVVVEGVEKPGGTVAKIGPIRQFETAVEELDLPVYDTDLPETDWLLAGFAFALAGLFLAVPLLVFASPAVETGLAVVLTFLLGPMFALPIGLLLWAGLRRV